MGRQLLLEHLPLLLLTFDLTVLRSAPDAPGGLLLLPLLSVCCYWTAIGDHSWQFVEQPAASPWIASFANYAAAAADGGFAASTATYRFFCPSALEE